MATTVLRNGIDRFKWQRPFTKGKFAPSTLPRTYGPFESEWGPRGLQGQKNPRGHATLPQHDGGAADGGETQKRPVSTKLDAKNEGGGDLRGLQAAIECAAAEAGGREKASVGRRGVEGPAESEIRETCRIHSTAQLAMVG